MIRWRWMEPHPARELLDQMLQQVPRQWRGEVSRGEPMPLNVHETATETVVEAALPGVKPEDVEITGSDGVLTIRARSEVEEKDYHHQEIYSIEYQRQLSVPQDVRLEQARAEFENGILRVHLPKLQPKQPERVRIEVTGGKSKTPIEAAIGDGYSEVQGQRTTAARKPGRSATGRSGRRKAGS